MEKKSLMRWATIQAELCAILCFAKFSSAKCGRTEERESETLVAVEEK
jgi:hypothetical protein